MRSVLGTVTSGVRGDLLRVKNPGEGPVCISAGSPGAVSLMTVPRNKGGLEIHRSFRATPRLNERLSVRSRACGVVIFGVGTVIVSLNH